MRRGTTDLEHDADLTIWRTRLDKWWQHWNSLKPLYDAEPTVPATVLDPFGGSGTVALVARQLGRDAILIDLSPEYIEMAKLRLAGVEIVEYETGGKLHILEQSVMFSDVEAG